MSPAKASGVASRGPLQPMRAKYAFRFTDASYPAGCELGPQPGRRARNTALLRRNALAYTVLSTGDMRTPKDEETLPEISTEQLAEVQGGAGFGDMMPFMMMMMMMQRQAPPPPVVAAPPPPLGDWTRVA